MQQYFKLIGPSVISEEMDQEIVIINLESGFYYSLNSSAAFIWRQIETQHPTEQMVKNFANYYGLNSQQADKEVQYFLQALIEENLVAIGETTDTAAELSPALNEKSEEPFQAPHIEKHSDMQEMLLLDPIHEVSEAGWPHKK